MKVLNVLDDAVHCCVTGLFGAQDICGVMLQLGASSRGLSALMGSV